MDQKHIKAYPILKAQKYYLLRFKVYKHTQTLSPWYRHHPLAECPGRDDTLSHCTLIPIVSLKVGVLEVMVVWSVIDQKGSYNNNMSPEDTIIKRIT